MNQLADVSVSFNGTLGTVFAVDLIFVIILFWPILFLSPFIIRAVLRDPSERLAKRAGLLPSAVLRRRLNRYLRLRRVLIVLVVLTLSQVCLFTLSLPDGGRPGHLVEIAVLPASTWLPSLLASAWPRWRSNGPVHLAHLRRLTVRDALTDREWVAVLAAYTAGGVVTIWAMKRADLAAWSVLAVALLALQALVAYAFAQWVMSAPAAGSDNLELAWDDVLRLERARSILGSGFVMLYFMAAAAGDLAGVTAHSLVVRGLLGAAVAVASSAWQRSSAYRNWRRRGLPRHCRIPSCGKGRLNSTRSGRWPTACFG
jgi:hypothetical protein